MLPGGGADRRHFSGPSQWETASVTERGHRTRVINRKRGKVVTIPLAPRTARATDLAIGERASGPLFLAAGGKRLDRHGAARVVLRITRHAGISEQVGPHILRHALTAALDAGAPLRDVQLLVAVQIYLGPGWYGFLELDSYSLTSSIPTASGRQRPEERSHLSGKRCVLSNPHTGRGLIIAIPLETQRIRNLAT